MTKLLAVYGTLKKGYRNNEVYLTNLNPKFEGFVKLPFELYTNGRYPMIVKSGQLNNVYLEVYEISDDQFTEITKLEEPFGYHYERIEIAEINDFVEVFVFTAGIPPSEFSSVESGNWKGTVPWD